MLLIATGPGAAGLKNNRGVATNVCDPPNRTSSETLPSTATKSQNWIRGNVASIGLEAAAAIEMDWELPAGMVPSVGGAK